MSNMIWTVGDWAVFDRNIIQIKEIRDYGMSVSDGSFETSGDLADRLRPLTLKNKRIAEWFDWHYNELRTINGEAGFNYPDISRYFSAQALKAMDGEDDDSAPFNAASGFVRRARDYEPVIDGISLFRPNRRVRA